MRGTVVGTAALLTVVSAAWSDTAYTVRRVKDSPPPKELAAAVRKLLASESVQLHDGSGAAVVEVWFRKEVPVQASEAQVANGLTYAEVPASMILGAVRLESAWIDYRKQKVPAGVYTLRLAEQPKTGDHAGTAPYTDFCLVCPAAEDHKPDLMDAKSLQELSAKTTEEHPSVLLLFPGKGATREGKLVDKGKGHWVLLIELPAKAGARKATLKLGLTLVGVSASR